MRDVAERRGRERQDRLAGGEWRGRGAGRHRARVDAAIGRLGFNRNDLASSLRGGRGRRARVGHRGRGQPVLLGHRAGGGGRRARARASSSSPAPARRTRARARLVTALLRRLVDALLIVPPARTTATWRRSWPPRRPIVFLDRPPGGVEADTVLLDNLGGTRAGGRAPARQGHERIAFVGDSPDLYTAAERLAGYRAALDRGGAADRRRARWSASAATMPIRPRRPCRSCSRSRRIAAPPRCSPRNNRNTVGAVRAARRAAPDRARRLRRLRARRHARQPVTVVRHAPEDMGGSPPSSHTPASTTRRARLTQNDRHRARDPRLRGGVAREAAASCHRTPCRASTAAVPRSPRCAGSSSPTTTCPRTGSAR